MNKQNTKILLISTAVIIAIWILLRKCNRLPGGLANSTIHYDLVNLPDQLSQETYE